MRVLIRHLRGDEEGVASTVGTIMALLVFLTFLSLIVNQYVPVWMKDTESAHMNTAVGQFGGLKGAIDLQMLAAQAAQYAGLRYIPQTTATAVSLGVDGVPIFAGPTIGNLNSFPDAGPFTVTYDYLIKGVRTRVLENSNGSIELDVGNRYFVPQRVVYENGAVIRYQSDGQVIRAPPTFSVIRTNNLLDVAFALVTVNGAGFVGGTNTEVVNSQLFGFDRQDYYNATADARIWINHTSRYGLAWYRFANATLASTLQSTPGFTGTYTQTALDVTFTARIGAAVIYLVTSSYNPTSQIYTMRIEIRNNPGVLAIRVFSVQHAQVQVGVGTSQPIQL
jgi:hypothetical protein